MIAKTLEDLEVRFLGAWLGAWPVLYSTRTGAQLCKIQRRNDFKPKFRGEGSRDISSGHADVQNLQGGSERGGLMSCRTYQNGG